MSRALLVKRLEIVSALGLYLGLEDGVDDVEEPFRRDFLSGREVRGSADVGIDSGMFSDMVNERKKSEVDFVVQSKQSRLIVCAFGVLSLVS